MGLQTMLDRISITETPTVVIFAAIIVLCLFSLNPFTLRGNTSRLPLPPGPPAHWLLGNSMPSPYAHRKFEEWTEEYGPVFTLRTGIRITIVIGRHQAAMDIMEKDGGSLADRPVAISVGDTLSGGMRILLVRAGNQFKKMRRALHARLSVSASANYEPIQMAHAKNVILDIINDPKNHQDHARRYAASVIMTVAYGKLTPTSYSDNEVIQVNKCLRRLGVALLPGAWLVDSYPILRYVPGYLNQLKQWHQEELQLFTGQLDIVRRNIAKGQAQDSFAKYLLEHQREYELSDNEIAYLAGSMFGAGSDTTAAAISTIVLAAAVFPEAQAKVQEELDLVIPPGRAPTFSDECMLPETRAFILEAYRWRPVSSGGFAHRATKDIIWRNYCIPAGATVIGNHWSIGLDPVTFPNPQKFDPQRWLTKDGRIRQDIKPFGFGFGRRVCPGRYFAEKSVFINTVLHLWAFRISELPTALLDTFAYTDSANAHPLPFEVKFEPRIRETELKAIMADYGRIEH